MNNNKVIAIIGSIQYLDKMKNYADELKKKGYTVHLPKTDFDDLTELEMCIENLKRIKEADEVHVFWDQRSLGTVFDLGMSFALGKKIKVVYLEQKTFANLLRQIEALKSFNNYMTLINEGDKK